MSIEAYQAVWRIEATGNDKVMLFAIAEFMSAKNGYTCWASVGTLAEMVGVGERAAKKILRRLEEAGHLEIETNRGRGNTNLYRLKGERSYRKGERSDTFNQEEKVNARTEKVNTEVKKVNARTIKGERSDTQTVTEPLRTVIEPGVNARAHEELTPPQKQLKTDLMRYGVSDLVWPLAFALQEYCEPVTAANLAPHAETLFGYDATPEEIKGVSNGYWTIRGKGELPYPSQVVAHLSKYRKWVKDGKPIPQQKYTQSNPKHSELPAVVGEF